MILTRQVPVIKKNYRNKSKRTENKITIYKPIGYIKFNEKTIGKLFIKVISFQVTISIMIKRKLL